jgi:hypothetical protein
LTGREGRPKHRGMQTLVGAMLGNKYPAIREANPDPREGA